MKYFIRKKVFFFYIHFIKIWFHNNFIKNSISYDSVAIKFLFKIKRSILLEKF